MYEVLIAHLRECAKLDPIENTYAEAADAIEKLSMKLHGDEAAIAGMKREIERMVVSGKPHWIPVTERLPEYGEKCLVVRKLHSHNDIRIDVSYCYVQREGFWSDNGRDWHVTHWMPLPEPPMEG